MPSTTTNYGLALYNNTTDTGETFLSYRTAVAGENPSSNMNLIDEALKDIQDQIDNFSVPVNALYDSPNFYTATASTITAYNNNMVIILSLDTDSNGIVTLDINSLGVRYLKKINSSGSVVDIDGSDLRENREYFFRYNSSTTFWMWVSSTSGDQINVEGTSGNFVMINSDNALEDSTYDETYFAVAAKGVTNGDSHDHIGGDGASITEGAFGFTDVTTADSTTGQHGLLPKLSGNSSEALLGDGTWGSAGGGTSLPAGVFMPYGGASAPSGWLLCDGSAVSRTTYSDLFTAIGTAYGVGDGSTTFNLPDMRGRGAIGAGTGTGGGASGSGAPTGGSSLTARSVGDWVGEETHTLTTAELASHSHTATTGNDSHTHGTGDAGAFITSANNNRQVGAGTNASNARSTTGSDTHSHTVTVNSSGSDSAHNNIQPIIVANYIIKT